MKTETKPINLEDLAIAQECTAHAQRLRKLAEQIREDNVSRRREMSRTHDAHIRGTILSEIVHSESRTKLHEATADVWADEAERWENGIE
jgi:hypothetical protein